MVNKIYFDWCALQNLYKKNDENVFSLISENFWVMISLVNIDEASFIRDSSQRSRFLKFCRFISKKESSILEYPESILKQSYLAYKSNKKLCNWNLKGFNFDFLENPESYNNEYIEKQRNKRKIRYKNMNDDYIQMNRSMRSDARIKKILNDQSIVKNPITFIELVFKLNDFLKSVFSIMLKTIGIDSFNEDEGPSVMKKLDVWRYFWSAAFLGTYHLAIKEKNYSPKKNVGIIDLKQIIYALVCDYFITDDNAFYEVLKGFINSKLFVIFKEIN